MRKKILAGNWKMNLDYAEAQNLLKELLETERNFNPNVEVVICPPSLYLSDFSRKLEGDSGFKLGGQNCYYEKNGAFTGEISTSQLKSVNAGYCLVGHSERRDIFDEGYELLSKKVKALINSDIITVFCCGEQLQVRESNVFKEYVMKQLEDCLFHLKPEEIAKVVIAYEPVWAIGTGKTASAEQAQEIHKLIRQRIASQFNEKVANTISILYGGSCKPDNAKELFSQPDIDGGLIGGASLKATDFLAISNAF